MGGPLHAGCGFFHLSAIDALRVARWKTGNFSICSIKVMKSKAFVILDRVQVTAMSCFAPFLLLSLGCSYDLFTRPAAMMNSAKTSQTLEY